MPRDVSLFTSEVLRTALRDVDSVRSSLATRNLVAISGGHDFLLQASNRMCAETAFNSLRLPWFMGQLDAAGITALRATGASFKSPALQRAVTAQVGTTAATDVLILFSPRDIFFDGVNQCRIRFNVRVALGSSFVMPKEPGLTRGLRPGEAVEQIVNPVRFGDPASHLSSSFLVNEMPTVQPPVMRTFSGDGPDIFNVPAEAHIDRSLGIRELDRHINLGGRTSFDVSAWLGNGVLEIPATFSAAGDPNSKTIKVAADVHESVPHFTELSGDAAVLLSQSDPLGFTQSTMYRVRQRSSATLVEDISLLGATANARAGHLGPLEAESFPTRTGACSLNVGATVAPRRVTARSAVEFIGPSRYGVIWSTDAVRLLVRYCWETGAFPRGIVQSQPLRVNVDHVEHNGESI
ncbi:MAG: hypothetical protein ACMG6H_06440, partial [Acidobacteriota bacterium]